MKRECWAGASSVVLCEILASADDSAVSRTAQSQNHLHSACRPGKMLNASMEYPSSVSEHPLAVSSLRCTCAS